MPSILPRIDTATRKILALLGGQIRLHRKALKITATATAEAAGMSRVTLHRIEKGEPSVSMAAYLSVISAVGMEFRLFTREEFNPEALPGNTKDWIPAQILISNYPQLKQLAWQMKASTKLNPVDALNLYERNWRHLDLQNMEQHEHPGPENVVCGIATLSPLDMVTSKLLANSDRWRDNAVFGRDLIDLAMMEPKQKLLQAAMAKAEEVYGHSIGQDLNKAIMRMQSEDGWLDRCIEVLSIQMPKALVWQKIKAVKPRS